MIQGQRVQPDITTIVGDPDFTEAGGGNVIAQNVSGGIFTYIDRSVSHFQRPGKAAEVGHGIVFPPMGFANFLQFNAALAQGS